MEKPKLQYADGILSATASVGIDGDHDGKKSLSVDVVAKIDAIEAVNEIIKDGVPQWLKDLIGSKA